jgi:hypothetical protein
VYGSEKGSWYTRPGSLLVSDGAGDPEKGADKTVDQILCREAREVVNLQVSTIEMTDRKAMNLLRTDLILIGLLLTSFSIVVRTDGLVLIEFANAYTLAGTVSLISGTVMAAVAYNSSTYDIGISGEKIRDAGEKGETAEELREHLRGQYKSWIELNSDVNTFNTGLVTVAMIGVVDAVILFGAGVVVGVFEASLTLRSIIAFIILLVVLAGIDAAIYWAESIFIKMFPNGG